MKMAVTSRLGSAGSRGAFTLVELLIVTVIMGVVITAVTSCLIAGVRCWDYARKYGSVESDVMIKLEIVHRDFANAFRIYSIPFDGDARSAAFPALVGTAGDESAPPRVGTIKYFYDAQKQTVFRKSWIFPSGEPLDGDAEIMITGVSDVKFSFYALPGKGEEVGAWQEGWNNLTNFPGAVSMELLFDTGGKRPLEIRRTVIVPAAVFPVPEQAQQSNPVFSTRK